MRVLFKCENMSDVQFDVFKSSLNDIKNDENEYVVGGADIGDGDVIVHITPRTSDHRVIVTPEFQTWLNTFIESKKLFWVSKKYLTITARKENYKPYVWAGIKNPIYATCGDVVLHAPEFGELPAIKDLTWNNENRSDMPQDWFARTDEMTVDIIEASDLLTLGHVCRHAPGIMSFNLKPKSTEEAFIMPYDLLEPYCDEVSPLLVSISKDIEPFVTIKCEGSEVWKK